MEHYCPILELEASPSPSPIRETSWLMPDSYAISFPSPAGEIPWVAPSPCELQLTSPPMRLPWFGSTSPILWKVDRISWMFFAALESAIEVGGLPRFLFGAGTSMKSSSSKSD
jgi:hypothetical protein